MIVKILFSSLTHRNNNKDKQGLPEPFHFHTEPEASVMGNLFISENIIHEIAQKNRFSRWYKETRPITSPIKLTLIKMKCP